MIGCADVGLVVCFFVVKFMFESLIIVVVLLIVSAVILVIAIADFIVVKVASFLFGKPGIEKEIADVNLYVPMLPT